MPAIKDATLTHLILRIMIIIITIIIIIIIIIIAIYCSVMKISIPYISMTFTELMINIFLQKHYRFST